MALQQYSATEQFVMDCDWSQFDTTGTRAFVIYDRETGEEVERSATSTTQIRNAFIERTRQRNSALYTLARLEKPAATAQHEEARRNDVAKLACYWAKEAKRLKVDSFAQKMAETFQAEAARFAA